MIDHYKHISFDLDGTLVHTAAVYRHEIIPPLIERLGGTLRSRDAINRFWFEGNRAAIIQEEFGLDPKTFWSAFHEIDVPEARGAHTNAYEDSHRVLGALKELGKTVSIITGASTPLAEIEINKLPREHVDFYTTTWSAGFPHKPEPDSMIHTLEKLGMRPEETIYIGNSDEDAAFAKRAGVDFILIDRSEHVMPPMDPHPKTIASLLELLRHF